MVGRKEGLKRAEVRQKPGPRQSLMHISMRRRTARRKKKSFPLLMRPDDILSPHSRVKSESEKQISVFFGARICDFFFPSSI
jgi:hypothetical protein